MITRFKKNDYSPLVWYNNYKVPTHPPQSVISYQLSVISDNSHTLHPTPHTPHPTPYT
ncbi:MAG: hypothetical protein GPJ22_24405 [Microcystis aeruginosa LL13-03]|nr:hypothetical protein [Microcystis aeruginosa LL13-03]